jgi:hypothetical protein
MLKLLCSSDCRQGAGPIKPHLDGKEQGLFMLQLRKAFPLLLQDVDKKQYVRSNAAQSFARPQPTTAINASGI